MEMVTSYEPSLSTLGRKVPAGQEGCGPGRDAARDAALHRSPALPSVVSEIITSSPRVKHPQRHPTCRCLSYRKIPVPRAERAQVRPRRQSIPWKKYGIQMPAAQFGLLLN